MAIEVVKQTNFSEAIAEKLNKTGGTMTGNLVLTGKEIQINAVDATGSWARGIVFKNKDGTIPLGGIGIHAAGTEVGGLYMGLGENPWSLSNGFYLSPTNIMWKGKPLATVEQMNALVSPTLYNVQFYDAYSSLSSRASKYTKMNGIVYFDIQVKKKDDPEFEKGEWITIAAFPAGFRPPTDLRTVAQVPNNTDVCSVNISSGGLIQLAIKSTVTRATVAGTFGCFYAGGGTV